MTKVYAVEFLEYTNCLRDAVDDGNPNLGKMQFIHIGNEPFLIKETELEKYKKFGGGFKSLIFVGNIEE